MAGKKPHPTYGKTGVPPSSKGAWGSALWKTFPGSLPSMSGIREDVSSGDCILQQALYEALSPEVQAGPQRLSNLTLWFARGGVSGSMSL